MNDREAAAVLAQFPLLANLPRPELESLAAALVLRAFEPGAVFMREGEHDNQCYLLLDGEAEVIKALGTPDERLLAVRRAGTLFGEMSLFDLSGQHTASVRARSSLSAYQITLADLNAVLRSSPGLSYEMMKLMSRRLEDSENATILDLRQKNQELIRAYQELQAAQEQLVAKEKLEHELAIAREIQESILPEELPTLPGFEIGALSLPARAVGGDYYDFIPLSGGRYGFVIGDACDKGVAAALFITLTNSLIHVEAPRNPSPTATLRMVNQHMLEMNRAGMFSTVLYGILDSAGNFEYARAGHPHPLILDAALRPLPSASGVGAALGLFEDSPLDVHCVPIPPGGLAVVYSDGLSEAPDPEGREYGLERLTAALAALCQLPAAQICASLRDQVLSFSGGQPQADDLTVIVIKRAPQ